jgi:LytS/YehU family sensor histidine kinase
VAPFLQISTDTLFGSLTHHVVRWFGWRVAVPVAAQLAQHPLTGFCLTLGVSLLRSGLVSFYAPNSRVAPHSLEEIGMAAMMQGLGTALILAIIEQVRDRDEQTRAAALAEIRALQARMNPHFLFNAFCEWRSGSA